MTKLQLFKNFWKRLEILLLGPNTRYVCSFLFPAFHHSCAFLKAIEPPTQNRTGGERPKCDAIREDAASRNLAETALGAILYVLSLDWFVEK